MEKDESSPNASFDDRHLQTKTVTSVLVLALLWSSGASAALPKEATKCLPSSYADLPLPPGESVQGVYCVTEVVLSKAPYAVAEFYRNYFRSKGGDAVNPFSEGELQRFGVRKKKNYLEVEIQRTQSGGSLVRFKDYRTGR